MIFEREYSTAPWEWDEEDGEWSRHYCFRFFVVRLLPWAGFLRQSYRYDGLPRTRLLLGWFLIAYGKDHGWKYSKTEPLGN